MLVLKYCGVVFDYFDTFQEHGKIYNCWSEICPHCRQKYSDKFNAPLLKYGSSGACGVEGCTNEADYYIDFPLKEVDIYNNKTVSE